MAEKKILITLNAITYNRGSEALVRGLVEVIRSKYPEAQITVCSGNKGTPQVNIDGVDKTEYRFFRGHKFNPFFWIEAASELLFKHQFSCCYRNLIKNAENAEYIFIIAGDNYDSQYGIQKKMCEVNSILKKNSPAKLCLIDFSLEKKDITAAVKEDIVRFSPLCAREHISLADMKDCLGKGVKINYIPDPAFFMKPQMCDIQSSFDLNTTIGINASDLIFKLKNEKMLIDNYIELMQYILEQTYYNILLIPHVMCGHDMRALNKLKEYFGDEERVQVLNDETLNASQLKYVIGQLKSLVTARTHASIAAYSQKVPTLVVGYSVKSKGIAQDIFGTYEGYVVNSDDLTSRDMLKKAFCDLMEREDEIRKRYEEVIPYLVDKSRDYLEYLD